MRRKAAANPDEIYRWPLFKTRPGAGEVDHDWLGGDTQKQPITLPRGPRYLEGILPRDVLHNKLSTLANRSLTFPGLLVAKLPGGLKCTALYVLAVYLRWSAENPTVPDG